jgi:SM-20-related protein
MNLPVRPDQVPGAGEIPPLFLSIAQHISTQGYSVHPNALPPKLLAQLSGLLDLTPPSQFQKAGIGRKNDYVADGLVRTDAIHWINDESKAGKAWLSWAAALQQLLNRSLFLGLRSFESHFAHYKPGNFYKKHLDAFKGEKNRVLSLILYLNPKWQENDGGELLFQTLTPISETVSVIPNLGTLVVFLSEDFVHEVLVAQRDRYSIAGWFRLP